MSLRSVNCKVNQIFPASFTFSMETVQVSYADQRIVLHEINLDANRASLVLYGCIVIVTGSHDSVVQNPFLGKIALCRKS